MTIIAIDIPAVQEQASLQEQLQRIHSELQHVKEHQTQELQHLQRQMQSLSLTQPTSTTYAEYYDQLNNKGLITVPDRSMGSVIEDHSIRVRSFSGTPPTGGEKAIVQPYWGELEKEINDNLEGLSSEVRFRDTHTIVTIGRYKPDILFTTVGGSLSVLYHVVVGELKTSDTSKSSDTPLDKADKGQLFQYLQELLKLQPYRKAVYGFLTDNRSLLLVRARRDGQSTYFDLILEETFDGGKAWKCLDYLATSTLENLYYLNPVPPEVQDTKLLGTGHSSIVYSGKYRDKEVVVKVSSTKQVQAELTVLKKLEEVENVPKIVDVVSDGVLLVEPVAKRFVLESLRSEHISQLVEVLRQAHEKGIVHRDVREPNIFITEEKKALLNDWGCACDSDTSPIFEGAVLEASDHILDALIESRWPSTRPIDDLHALARCIYSFTRHVNLPIISNPPTVSQLKVVKSYWESTAPHWKSIFLMIEKIQRCNKEGYDEFAKTVSQLLLL